MKWQLPGLTVAGIKRMIVGKSEMEYETVDHIPILATTQHGVNMYRASSVTNA